MIKLRKKKLHKDVINNVIINKLQNVLQHHISLLNDNNFLELYKIIRNSELGEYGVSALTDVLTQAKIDPLIYMDEIPDKCFEYCDDLISIDIPNNVKSIKSSAFADCHNLTNITIPNSVTSIDYMAFYNCWKLTSIVIPNGVTAIGVNTFYNCGRLKSVVIPNSVISIGQSAFEDCRGLTNITIPDSVTSIGGSAFSGCKSLESINYLGTKKHLYSIISQFSLYDIPKNYIIHCKDGDISL